LLLLAKLGMGQGQEHIIEDRTSLGQGDRAFWGSAPRPRLALPLQLWKVDSWSLYSWWSIPPEVWRV
jgi:hypothetical protein